MSHRETEECSKQQNGHISVIKMNVFDIWGGLIGSKVLFRLREISSHDHGLLLHVNDTAPNEKYGS